MTFGDHGSSAEAKRAVSTTRVREFRKRQKLGLMVRKVRISPSHGPQADRAGLPGTRRRRAGRGHRHRGISRRQPIGERQCSVRRALLTRQGQPKSLPRVTVLVPLLAFKKAPPQRLIRACQDPATNAICHGFQVGKAHPITRRTGTGMAAVTAGISGMSSCNSSSIA